MRVRNSHAECLRFPGLGLSPQGESGPKTRPKGVVDGKQVNIPVPELLCLSVSGDGEGKVSRLLDFRFNPVGGFCRTRKRQTQRQYSETG